MDEAYVDGTFGARAQLSQMSEGEKNWDGTTMRYVPYALRGLKPVTNEPWARDEAVYRKDDGMSEIPDEFVKSEQFSFLTTNDSPTWDASEKPPTDAMRPYPK